MRKWTENEEIHLIILGRPRISAETDQKHLNTEPRLKGLRTEGLERKKDLEVG